MAAAGTSGYAAAWLKDWSWKTVGQLNADICQQGRAQHGPTSDGHAAAKAGWERARAKKALSLAEVITLCQACHRQAPFLNYNGNTFVALVRTMCARLPLDAVETANIRQLAGHMVAGVLPAEQEAQFLRALQGGTTLPAKPAERKKSASGRHQH